MFVWTKRVPAETADTFNALFLASTHLHPVITSAPGGRTARLDVYCGSSAAAVTLHKRFGGTVRRLRHQNWAALSMPAVSPVRIRDRLVIVGAKSSAEIRRAGTRFPGRVVIAVPPDMAFGTGHHATTATVLRFLADAARQWDREGRKWSMIDLGCGSGILGIAARKLGAARVWSCDSDPLAVRVARANLKRNSVRGATVKQLDVLKWKPSVRHDCVVANMFSELLVAAFPQMVRAVKPDGVVMVSGILASQSKTCLAAGSKAGLRFVRIVRCGRWISALGRPRKTA